MMRQGERQPDPHNVAPDHKARYVLAAHSLAGKSVFDAGCGVGYGSLLLAEAGCTVTAVDNCAEAIEIAKRMCPHENITYICDDLLSYAPEHVDAIVAFEVLEHLEDPEGVVRKWNSDYILASVPHEGVLKFTSKDFPFHHRHFYPNEFEYLLQNVGRYKVEGRWCQKDKWDGGAIQQENWEEGRILIAYGVAA